MKKLLLLLIIPFLSFSQIVTEDCNSIPDPGICLAYIQTFYFDQTTSQCEESYWGGCGGVVPFWTLEDCQNSCENIETCDPLYDCGPPLGMPNYFCNDSITLAGPGDCIMNENGECFWEIIYCPEEIGCTDPLACNYNPSAIVGNFDDGSCLYEGGTCILVVDDYCSCCSGPCDGICPYELLDSLYGENWFCFYDIPDSSYQEGQILVSGFINENCECVANELDYCSQLNVANVVVDNLNMTIDIAIYDGNIGGESYPYIAYTIDNLGDTIQTGNINSFGNLGLDTSWYEYSLNSLPNYPLTVYYVYGMNPDTCVLTYNPIPVAIEEYTTNKKLLHIIDILGRETTNKGLQLHIYDDGSVEKKYLIK